MKSKISAKLPLNLTLTKANVFYVSKSSTLNPEALNAILCVCVTIHIILHAWETMIVRDGDNRPSCLISTLYILSICGLCSVYMCVRAYDMCAVIYVHTKTMKGSLLRAFFGTTFCCCSDKPVYDWFLFTDFFALFVRRFYVNK